MILNKTAWPYHIDSEKFNHTNGLLPTTQLHITTLNVNELHDHNKPDLLINRKTDITFLQETHSTPETAKKWEKEWKKKSMWHSGSISKASGVVMVFAENSNIEVIHSPKNKDWQILQCSILSNKRFFNWEMSRLQVNHPAEIAFIVNSKVL